jgi:general secretion pathway protein D
LIRRSLYLSTALVALASCQSQKPQPLLETLPPVQGNGNQPSRVSGLIATPSGGSAAPTIELGGPGPGQQKKGGADAGGDVTLDFADTDIREVVKQVLGATLKVNYTIDPSVHGNATIETNHPLPRSEVIPALEALLNQDGATIVKTGSLYRIVPTAIAPSLLNAGGDSSSGSQIVPLHFGSATELVKVLTPYVGDGVKLVAEPAQNAILISGEPSARIAVESLIHSFDTDQLAGQSYALFPVTTGDPDKVVTELQKVFQTEGEGALAGIVRVVPMSRVNAVLVVSSQPRYIQDAKRLFDLVEQGRLATARSWSYYYVQNGQSNDLANLLQQAFTPGNVTAHPEQPGTTAPGFDQSGFNSSSGSSGGSGSSFGGGSSSGGSTNTLGSSGLGQSGGGSTNGSLPKPPSGGGEESSSPATESLSAGSDEKGSDANHIHIIPDKTRNAIMIYATPSERSEIDAVLYKLDVQPLQVMIDATIAEVTLNDSLQYGTQFTGKASGIEGLLSSASGATSSTLTGLSPGLTISRVGGAGNAQFVLSALSSVTKVKVLSSPQVLALDNRPARLLVGNDVPLLSQSAQSTLTSTADIVNEVTYRETGVILQVIPHVNSSGLVTMDLSQEVSAASTTSSSTINSPTFTERKIETGLAVQDGQTISIAGLITDDVSEGNSGIPYLKDIPIVGSLFSTQTNSRDRTELIVLITPHVVQDQRGARALTEDLRQSLKAPALVPQELRNKPSWGLSNPNAQLKQ